MTKILNRNKLMLVPILVFFISLFVIPIVKAQDTGTALDNNFESFGEFLFTTGYGGSIGESSDSQAIVLSYVKRILAVLFSFLGIVFFVLTTYAGWQWMTAGCNEEQVDKAKKLLRNSVIGLGIIFAAYIISYFVLYWVGMNLYQFESWG